jgi:hypothetical protein
MRQVGGLPDLEGFLEIVFDLGDDGGEVELGLHELLALESDVFAQAGIGGECGDVFSELDRITCLIGESVHALLKQFGVAAFLESLGDVSTAELVTADIVGRVDVGEDEDAHTLPS